MIPTTANDQPAAAVYRRDAGGALRAHGIVLLSATEAGVSRVVEFHDPSLVGYLYAATYVGALVASALGGWANHVRRQGVVVVVAAAVWGAAIAAFGFATELWLALVLLALAGGADLVSAVMRSTMLLELTPDSLRGRLVGIEFAQVASAPALGNLEAGALASLTSLRTSIVSGGVACVAGCALLALAFPALLRYDARKRAPAPA